MAATMNWPKEKLCLCHLLEPKHGKIAMRIGAFLWRYMEEYNLGEVYAAETGFTIEEDPDTVRITSRWLMCVFCCGKIR